MPLVGFEPTISAGKRPQTNAFDRAAHGISDHCFNAPWKCIPLIVHAFILFFSTFACMLGHCWQGMKWCRARLWGSVLIKFPQSVVLIVFFHSDSLYCVYLLFFYYSIFFVSKWVRNMNMHSLVQPQWKMWNAINTEK